MRIEAVKVRRLYLEVADQIERLIQSGEIKPGERLPPERDLAKSFEVSRPTVREAMIALEVAGLVEIRTGSGIYALDSAPKGGVIQQSIEDVPGPFEILEARLVIEPETAALAAARISEEQVEALESALSIMADSSYSVVEREKADERFHCTIMEASNNSGLDSIVQWLWELRNNSDISVLFQKRIRETGMHPSVEEHRRVLSALKSRDPVRARSAMQAHISNAIEQHMQALNPED